MGNTHISNLINYCLQPLCGIGIDKIQEFSQLCNYPSNWGKLDKSALDPRRLKGETIASFSSPILTIITVVMMFLEKFVAGLVPEHVNAFEKLYHIVGILRMGPEDAMQHIDTLQILMTERLSKCNELYPGYKKPKEHHMLHIVDGMAWIGRLLSCFVTERKHRMVKECCVNVFRNFEHTVLTDIVNQSMQQVLDGHDLYLEEFLICPKQVVLDTIQFRVANRCVTRVGMICAGDLVINDIGGVGKVVKVFQRISDNLIFLEIDAYPCLPGKMNYLATSQQHRDFFASKSIIDLLIWYFDSPGIIRFSIPAALLYKKV